MKYYINSQQTITDLELIKILLKESKTYSDIVFACIGVNRDITYDMLGPIVGYYLQSSKIPNVYGTLSLPFHYLNFDRRKKEIYRKFKNPFIIAVDAAVGQKGRFTFHNEPLQAAAGTHKAVKEIGNATITFTTTTGFLESTRIKKQLSEIEIWLYATTIYSTLIHFYQLWEQTKSAQSNNKLYYINQKEKNK